MEPFLMPYFLANLKYYFIFANVYIIIKSPGVKKHTLIKPKTAAITTWCNT